jgi:hypothetical protein
MIETMALRVGAELDLVTGVDPACGVTDVTGSAVTGDAMGLETSENKSH